MQTTDDTNNVVTTAVDMTSNKKRQRLATTTAATTTAATTQVEDIITFTFKVPSNYNVNANEMRFFHSLQAVITEFARLETPLHIRTVYHPQYDTARNITDAIYVLTNVSRCQYDALIELFMRYNSDTTISLSFRSRTFLGSREYHVSSMRAYQLSVDAPPTITIGLETVDTIWQRLLADATQTTIDIMFSVTVGYVPLPNTVVLW